MATKASAPTTCHCESHGKTAPAGSPVIALVGAPNAGKSTLFNGLTGAKARMGNWPGTTVEVSRGAWKVGETTYDVIDFPGAYSLDPISPDEKLTRDLVIDCEDKERPDLVLVAVDAASLGRSLYMVSQLAEKPFRTVVVMTKTDVADSFGTTIDAKVLEKALGVRVLEVDPRHRSNLVAVGEAVTEEMRKEPKVLRPVTVPAGADPTVSEFDLADARFAWVEKAVAAATTNNDKRPTSWSERIDKVALHPVFGPLMFLATMWIVFQITTTVAKPMQDGLDALFGGPVSDAVRSGLQAVGLTHPLFEGLIVNGLIGGVGMVKAFIPLIVGFGCNVPAISATRVLTQPRQRLLTALLIPFTSCSARLTVYVMLAATFYPNSSGTVVFAMYLISIGLVVLVGLAMKNSLWRRMGSEPLVIDLPVYQIPGPKLALSVMWVRLKGFLSTAGGIIVVTVTVVFLLQSTPVVSGYGFADENLQPQDSVYGKVSDGIAPIFAPAGFGSWSIAGTLITGFVAKEAVISSWAQTYALDDPTEEDSEQQGTSPLAQAIKQDFNNASGGHTHAAVWAFMVFLLAYTPCVATLAAQRREIGLKWTLIGIAIQLFTAWALAVVIFQVLKLWL